MRTPENLAKQEELIYNPKTDADLDLRTGIKTDLRARVLSYVARHGKPVTKREICNAMSCTYAAAKHLLTRLTETGYFKKHINDKGITYYVYIEEAEKEKARPITPGKLIPFSKEIYTGEELKTKCLRAGAYDAFDIPSLPEPNPNP